MGNNKRTFIRITNKDIFDEIKGINVKLDKVCTRTKVNSWISRTALGLITATIIALLSIRL